MLSHDEKDGISHFAGYRCYNVNERENEMARTLAKWVPVMSAVVLVHLQIETGHCTIQEVHKAL